MANTKNNQGAQRTRASIEQVFMELAAESPLRQITVSQIVAACQISRGTFYLHYHDVYELAERVGQDALDELEQALAPHMNEERKTATSFPFLIELFSYLKVHSAQARFVFSDNATPGLRTRMTELMRRYCESALNGILASAAEDERIVLEEYIGSGLFGVVKDWVANDCPGDPERMAYLAGVAVTQGAYGFQVGTES